ncbi:MAG: hypothetical protein ABI528_06280 [bacterium]
MNHKAFDILKTFSKEDIKSFATFLDSPFFKIRENVYKLYNLLRVFHPDYNSKSLTDECLYSRIYPEKPYNSSTMRNLFSELAAAIELYLSQLNFSRRKFSVNDFLCDELFKRDLGSMVENTLKKSEEIIKSRKEFSAEFLLDSFQLATDKLNFLTLGKPRSNITYIDGLKELHCERSRYITYIYVREMIKGYDQILTLEKTFNVDMENNFILDIFSKINFPTLVNFLADDTEEKIFKHFFEVYHAMLTAFMNVENDKYYFEYRKSFNRNTKHLDADERRFHSGRLIRYCMKKSMEKTSAKKFNEELLDLYDEIIHKEYYISDLSTHLPIELFRSALNHSLKMKKFKWAISFINRCKKKLHPDNRENMYHYSCVKYYFHTGKYEKANKHFENIQLSHFMLKIDLRNIMLKTYYEQQNYESAIYLIDTYKHFLTNDITLSSLEKKRNKQFVTTVQKMIEYRNYSNPLAMINVEKYLEEELPEKEWVIEKMMELEKKYYKSA